MENFPAQVSAQNTPSSHSEEAFRALRQAQEQQQQRWRLDVPLWRLAAKGLLFYIVGALVGLGLGVLYQVILPLL